MSFQHYLRPLTIGTLIVAWAHPAGGQAVQKPADGPTAAAVANMPVDILPQIIQARFPEQVIAQLMVTFRLADRDRDGLGRADIERLEQKEAVERRAHQISRLLRNDLDGDGQVSEDEILGAARMEGGPAGAVGQRAAEQAVKNAMRSDKDGNRVITYAEMLAPLAEEGRSRMTANFLATFFEADPNDDGRLTDQELEGLIRGWFAAIDVNSNRYLDEAELAELGRAIAPAVGLSAGAPAARPPFVKKPGPRDAEGCRLPKARPEELVFAAGVYEADAVSTIALAGPHEVTNVTRVVIAPGTQPVYLFLNSYESMVWEVAGAVDRVSRAIVTSFRTIEGGNPAAGVVGLDRARIIFVDRKACDLKQASVRRVDDKRSFEPDPSLAIGRVPDSTALFYSVEAIEFPAAKPVAGTRSQPLPEGFDSYFWKQHLHYTPAGVKHFEPEQIISPEPPQIYAVLPQMAGVAQLVGNGSMEWSGWKLRIVKSIPSVPAGMSIGLLANLVIGKGVTLPKGSIGVGCLIEEVTGKYVCEQEKPAVRPAGAAVVPAATPSVARTQPPPDDYGCSLPKAQPEEVVFAAGVYESDAVSSIALAGQGSVTNATRVVIAPGVRPVYLLLNSYGSMVWEVTGAVGRVSRAVVTSFTTTQSGKPAAGVIGLDRARISFVEKKTCGLRQASNRRAEDKRSLEPDLSQAIGRTPDVIALFYSVEAIEPPSAKPIFGTKSQPAPKGFDDFLWSQHLQYSPAGVKTFDARRIISPEPPQSYAVLPQLAGAAQLVGDGSMKWVGEELRIFKQIPSMPAGFDSALFLDLVRGKKMKLPAGNFGVGCSLAEATGQWVCETGKPSTAPLEH